jgi:PIN domain nuclease of toxin-antitoxin system
VKVLLDSHIVLWWSVGSNRLGGEAYKRIADPTADLYMSAASWWELGLKVALGKLEADLPGTRAGLQARGVKILPVTVEHAEASAAMPVLHRDPFDHLLVAQAKVEGMVLLTRDRKLKPYGSAVLCV